jgi:hypothetical protein
MPTKKEDQHLHYPFDKIRTLFLLDDSAAFAGGSEHFCTPRAMKQILAILLTATGFEDEGHAIQFGDAGNIQSLGSTYVGNGGGYMVHCTYTHDGVQKFAMAATSISEMTTPEGKFPFHKIHFILTGDVERQAAETPATLIAKHTACPAITDDDNVTPLYPDNQQAFYAFLCYGRTLLKQLVKAVPINITENQFWLQPQAIQIADAELPHYLAVKTHSDILAEIAFDDYARRSHMHTEQFPTRFPN